MKQKRPRLIKYKPTGTPCALCKYSIAVDSKHDRYYCTNPNERAWIYYGEHMCGKGEQK